MSEASEKGPRDWANGLGAVAAIICAFGGYAQGGWIGAIIGAVAAFGGVHLMFTAIGLAFRLAIGAAILAVMLAVLVNRAQWLGELFQ